MENLHIHGGDVYSYPDVIDFSANCNAYGTPESVKRAAAEALELICHYPDVDCRELRRAISETENVPQKQIICGNGAADLIFGLTLAKKPKRALLPAPTFAEYAQALSSVGCEPEFFYLKEETGFVPGEDFLAHITKETDIVFFCNPNNPTGVLMDLSYMRRLAEKCRECGCLLVLDECFHDFVGQPEKYSFRPYLTEFSNVFLVKAFTKKYAMAGLRLGYGFCADEALIKKMRSVMQPWNVSNVAQKAGVAALKEELYTAETMKKIRAERAYLLENMKDMGLTLYASQANYIFFRGPAGLREKCLAHGILIRDCANYEGLTDGYYRVAVRTREENEKLLETLRKLLKERQV